MTDIQLPGRLGDPAMTLGDDPRLDPRLRAMFEPLGLLGAGEPPPLGPDAPRDQLLQLAAVAEEGFEALFGAVFSVLEPVEGVERDVVTIPGDGGEITLFVHRPAGAAGPLPCVYHVHGGGMVILRAAAPAYSHYRDEVASTGVVVVGVEFRNGAGALGPHPFPAGLDDCVAGLRWVVDHREDLGVDAIVVSGESGGGNLSLATVLTAKRQGWSDEIAGVYAQCPYVSGAYGAPPAELASLVENDTYFLDNRLMAIFVEVYDPGGAHADDPTCWPLRATVDDLAGLPPHVVSVNELDPLRDEGLAFLRKLWAAGVAADGRMVPGTTHAGDLIGRPAIGDVTAATIADLRRFVDRVATPPA